MWRKMADAGGGGGAGGRKRSCLLLCLLLFCIGLLIGAVSVVVYLTGQSLGTDRPVGAATEGSAATRWGQVSPGATCRDVRGGSGRCLSRDTSRAQ